MCLSFLKNNQTKVRLGWTISKYIGTAVVRNKFKDGIDNTLEKNFKNITIYVWI